MLRYHQKLNNQKGDKMSAEEVLLEVMDNRRDKKYCMTRHTCIIKPGTCEKCQEKTRSVTYRICTKCAIELGVCKICLELFGKCP